MKIIHLLPTETVAQLMAQGYLSLQAVEQANAELAQAWSMHTTIQTVVQTSVVSGMRREELVQMMNSFPGQQPHGTSLRRVGKRWRQVTKL